jgi:hypothetical protein
MSDYSDEFIASQVEYYRKHLSSGNFHDRSLISGALRRFESEQNLRAKAGAQQLNNKQDNP